MCDRSRRGFVAAVGVAVVILSGLIDTGARSERVVTGRVTEITAGESIVLVNQAMRVGVMLTKATEYGDHDRASGLDPAVIVPGTHVQVWYRYDAAERWRPAHKIRVLPEPPPR